MYWLLEDVDADVNGTAVIADSSSKGLAVWGTDFDGGTVSIQGSPDGGATWILLKKKDGTTATFTNNEITIIDRLGQGCLIRAILSGAGVAASGVNARMFE